MPDEILFFYIICFYIYYMDIYRYLVWFILATSTIFSMLRWYPFSGRWILPSTQKKSGLNGDRNLLYYKQPLSIIVLAPIFFNHDLNFLKKWNLAIFNRTRTGIVYLSKGMVPHILQYSDTEPKNWFLNTKISDVGITNPSRMTL